MTQDKDAPPHSRTDITPGLIVRWSLPAVVSLGVLIFTFAMGWEPWFGYAAMIAGALGSLMYVGRSLGIGES